MRTDGVEVFGLGLLGMIQIPAQLQVHPEVCRHTKILCQPQSDAGCDALVVGDNFVDAWSGYVNELRQLALVNSHWCQEFFDEHFAGMCWRSMCGNADNGVYLNLVNGN